MGLFCHSVSFLLTMFSGSGRKASPVLEHSSMVVETVEKKAGSKTTKKFRGDASKVVARGAGLKKAFMGRAQNFTIDVREAGTYIRKRALFGQMRTIKLQSMRFCTV